MHVLICDDDSANRFVVKRLLEENFGCGVRECSDGVEALHFLASEKYAFMLLDVDTPMMNGLETLEEIRESPATTDLPVIIMSREREEETVLNFMRLGISDYVLKPARANTLVPKIDRLMRMLPASAVHEGNVNSISLAPDTPGLLVDGNPDFRFFFASQVERYGPIIHATSGAAALAAFRRSPVRVVFVGGDLGVVTAGRLGRKLRELSPHGVRLIRIANADEPQDAGLFDGVIARSYVPDTLAAALRPYVFVPGPFAALSAVVPELPDMLASATTQVFGMMFDSEIATSEDATALEPNFHASVEIVLDKRFVITLAIHLPKQAAAAAAARMVGLPEAEIGDDECLSVAGELDNMVTGRIQARFRERSLTSTCALPILTAGADFMAPNESNGLVCRYSIGGGLGDFLVSIVVDDRLEHAKAEVEHVA